MNDKPPRSVSRPRHKIPNHQVRAAGDHEELRRVRHLGYAISCSELEEGIDAVAAPIFDHLGTVVASVSIGGPSERCHPKQPELIGAVTQAGLQISQALRYVSWH